MLNKSYPATSFSYKYLAGPEETIEGMVKAQAGNCRFALQVYFYSVHGLFLKKDQIYLPGGYKTIGRFIFEEEAIDFNRLCSGDIVYAQNLRNKRNELLNKNPEQYASKDEWLYYLHSAIYIGKIDGLHYLWHATNIEGGPVVWQLEKFQHYYKPISAKRVL